jgi:hypothetical protein
MTTPVMPEQDPLEALKQLRAGGGSPATASATPDPLEQLKAMRPAPRPRAIAPVVDRPAPETSGDRWAGRISAAYQGLTLGAGTKITAAIRTALPESLGGEPVAESGGVADTFRNALREDTEILDTYRRRHPFEALGAEAAGSLPVGMASEVATLLRAPETASRAARLARLAAEGAGFGATAGALEGVRPGATIGDVGRGAGAGAVAGGLAGPVIGSVAAPIVRSAARGVARFLPERASEAVTRSVGAPSATPAGEARGMMRDALLGGGVDLEHAAADVRALPADQPTSMLELGSRPVASLTRAARNVPTSTAAQTTDRFLSERAAGTGKRIEAALQEATGHTVTDPWLPIEELIGQRAAAAKPLYEQAYAHGQVQDPETVGEIHRLLKEPVFQNAWKRGESVARIEGSAPAEATPSTGGPAAARPAPARTARLRDEQGRIRRDLRKVSDEDLDAEWQRLAQMNEAEEAGNAAVEEAGYRSHYEDLPRTEKLGRKGQEDLPDADGMVDADVLARDNKTVSEYRRGGVVRAARQKLLDRIQEELAGRPSAGDFEFGANKFVPNRESQPALPTVRQIDRWKKGLDAVIESGRGSSDALSRTEARAYRQALNGVLERVDAEVPAYKAARSSFRGHSELIDAATEGAHHFTTSREGVPVSTDVVARSYAKLSPPEQEVYRANALNTIVAKVRQAAASPDLPEAGRATNLVQRILGSADAGERLGMLFPDEPSFDRFLGRMEDEALYPKTVAFLKHQSSTAAQLQEGMLTPQRLADMVHTATSGRRIGQAVVRQVLRGAFGVDVQGPIPPAVANEIGHLSVAKGQRLAAVLEQMRGDQAARDVGRGRLATMLRGSAGADAGEQRGEPPAAPRP